MKCPQCQADISDDSRFCSKCGTPVQASERIAFSQTRTILRPMEELAPETLLAGKYRILEVVGRGGMGIVYDAEDTKLQRHVALKFLPPELVRNPEARERFVLEARAAAALSHPNICTIYEIHDEGEKPFIAMEYIEGQSLKAKMAKHPMSTEDALDLAIQVSEGLEEAHKKGIIHRDIKSANIMVTDKGQAKIMDFGLAKVKGGTLLTREGTTLGTVAYMSPEQALGKEVDHRTDIWSLGVVLYELLSGKLPFQGDHEASILYTVVHEEPKPLKAVRPDIAPELQHLVSHALKKNAEARYASAEEMGKDLRKFRDSLKVEAAKAFSVRALLRFLRRPIMAVPMVIALVAIAVAAVWFFNRQAKIRWAKEQALPEIVRLIDADKQVDAYFVANEAEKYIPNSQELSELRDQLSSPVTINTTPEGADIFFGRFKDLLEELEYLGRSPINNIPLPQGYLRLKVVKDHYAPYQTVLLNYRPREEKPSTPIYNITLDEAEKLPEGMVRIPAQDLRLSLAGYDSPETIPSLSYLIDKYEVTNRQFKEFVDDGGYEKPEYWKEKFIKDGQEIPWHSAMSLFRDQTGRPGPSTWAGGTYPEGQDDYPVSGVSWFESAAYAEYAEKSLPTIYHWLGATNMEYTAVLVQHSNYNGVGPLKVGSYPAGPYGVYDMSGNVREWCWNSSAGLRYILGGAWNDPGYMFHEVAAMPPFDRSQANGFRCARYVEEKESLLQAKYPVDIPQIDWRKEQPVSEEIFQIYKNLYRYDPKPLKPIKISFDNTHAHWIKESVEINAAYGDERLRLHIFIPKNVNPPFQTVIFFPGSSVLYSQSSENLLMVPLFDFIVMSGRAFVYPVYKGSYERSLGLESSDSRATREYANWAIQVVNDARRTIDYVETRNDIDREKIVFYGYSWGGRLGSIVMAVEERIKLGMLLVGGFNINRAYPEVTEINFAPRVKAPVLMINGRYDAAFPLETSVKPMFQVLGSSDKELKLLDAGHNLSYTHRNTVMSYVLDWLDKHWGPVK
jgi:predicted Ser/Thr protein kinase/predicted esterase